MVEYYWPAGAITTDRATVVDYVAAKKSQQNGDEWIDDETILRRAIEDIALESSAD